MENSSCIVVNSHASCFDVLNENERALLDENKTSVEYRKGEMIAKQGAFASHVIFLEEGLVKVYLEGEQKDLIVKIVPSQHFVGLSSIYEGNSLFRYSTASFVETKVNLYDREIFVKLLRNNPEFAYKIVSIVNENASQVYGRFYCLMRKQAHGRLADLLLCLADRVYKQKKFFLPISRGDFADLTGLSVESVSRIFKEFKDEELIDIQGSNFEILNSDSLIKISSYG